MTIGVVARGQWPLGRVSGSRRRGAVSSGRSYGGEARSALWERPAQETFEMMNRIRELTGIYGLGFNKSSVMGLLLPLAIVGGVAVLSLLWIFVL